MLKIYFIFITFFSQLSFLRSQGVLEKAYTLAQNICLPISFLLWWTCVESVGDCINRITSYLGLIITELSQLTNTKKRVGYVCTVVCKHSYDPLNTLNVIMSD